MVFDYYFFTQNPQDGSRDIFLNVSLWAFYKVTLFCGLKTKLKSNKGLFLLSEHISVKLYKYMKIQLPFSHMSLWIAFIEISIILINLVYLEVNPNILLSIFLQRISTVSTTSKVSAMMLPGIFGDSRKWHIKVPCPFPEIHS